MEGSSLEQVAAAHERLVEVVGMIPNVALDWQPGGGNWSLREIMSHLAHANNFYVMIVEEVRASAFGNVRLHPGLVGFQRMEATNAAVAQSSTATDVLECFEHTYQQLLAILHTITAEEAERPFNLSYSWQPEASAEQTVLRTRVLEMAAHHLLEHQTQLIETLHGWRVTQEANHDMNPASTERS